MKLTVKNFNILIFMFTSAFGAASQQTPGTQRIVITNYEPADLSVKLIYTQDINSPYNPKVEHVGPIPKAIKQHSEQGVSTTIIDLPLMSWQEPKSNAYGVISGPPDTKSGYARTVILSFPGEGSIPSEGSKPGKDSITTIRYFPLNPGPTKTEIKYWL